MQLKSINIKNKKAQMLNQEFVLVIISIVLIAVILFLSFKYVGLSRDDIEKMSPEITYQYPALYVHTFLLKEVILSKEQIELIKGENSNIDIKSEVKYQIKDLLMKTGDDTNELEDIINEFKNDEYRKQIKSTLENYNKFSSESIESSYTLVIDYDKNEIPNLENELCNKNYFFYLKNSNNKFVIVYFKSKASSQNICESSSSSSVEENEYLDGEGSITEQENGEKIAP